MDMLFIILLFLSIYSYLLYPPILFVFARVMQSPWTKGDAKPTVSIIISAYNEERVIREKILNTLALDYPGDLLEIVVNSDGSTDGTNEIVAGFEDSRIVLRVFERLGKTACLNRAVPEAKGKIVLFSDANSMYPSTLLTNLVKNFADPDVGLVTGWTKYRMQDGGQETTSLYSRLEKITKSWESRISSCVGADGAIFAIRKSLYVPLEEHDINDFVIPLNLIKQGKRVVLDSAVFCFEEPSGDSGKEYKRQVRITTRTLNAIRHNIAFLNPFKFGFFSFFLMSHKVIRFLVPIFLIGTFVSNLFLLKISSFYIMTFFGQIMFYILGLIGILGFYDGRIANVAKFFLLTLLAQFVGSIRLLFGVSDTIWTPQR